MSIAIPGIRPAMLIIPIRGSEPRVVPLVVHGRRLAVAPGLLAAVPDEKEATCC
jgi:hypothetical protein